MRGPSRPRSDTAAGIRAAAIKLFSSQGYDTSTLREIAETLGISKAAVYYHYRTKAEILDSLVGPLADAQRAIVDVAEAQAAAAADPAWQLTVIGRYVDVLLEHRLVAAYAFRDFAVAAGSGQLRRVREDRARLVTVLLNGDVSVERRVRMSAALGAITAVLSVPGTPDYELPALLRTIVRDVLASSP